MVHCYVKAHCWFCKAVGFNSCQILWMEEILHQLVDGQFIPLQSHEIYSVKLVPIAVTLPGEGFRNHPQYFLLNGIEPWDFNEIEVWDTTVNHGS